VILRGAGERAFAAGADVEEMSEMSPSTARQYSEAGQSLAWLMEAAPFPIIAMVQGFALGGGCELALAADFIIASTRARFGQPEAKLGLMPGFGATARLSRRVGIARARELIYTGRIIDAEEALTIGLVNRVCAPDDLVEQTERLAKTIAANAPLAVGAAKRVLARGQDSSIETATELEANAFAVLFGTDDTRAGMKDFLDKRSGTRFEGK
jgi:enoyl-CoA hydratase